MPSRAKYSACTGIITGVGCREGVDCYKAKRRRAVDNYKVVFVFYARVKQGAKHSFAVLFADELYLSSGEVYAEPTRNSPSMQVGTSEPSRG